jgi:hypothetical protein
MERSRANQRLFSDHKCSQDRKSMKIFSIYTSALLICILLVAACTTAQQTSTPSSTSLPDLVVTQARSSLNPPLCLGSHSRAGSLVNIENVGGTDAGPFVVTVNGVDQTVSEGLAAGANFQLFFEAQSGWTDIQVTVDSASQVAESDESNNSYVAPMITLTPPLPCTPTPSD